jgi:hypothetical protein
MFGKQIGAWSVFGLGIVAAIVSFVEVGGIVEPVSCAVIDATEAQRTAVMVLDGIVNLNIQLATALVGVGAALLIGLRQDFKPGPSVAVILLLAVLAFSMSVVHGLWWKSRVAAVSYAGCLDLLSGDFVQRAYSWHIYNFIAGFGLLSVMLVVYFGRSISEGTTK